MTIITAENLGKKYTIGHQRQGNYLALRDVLTHTARGVWQRIRHPLSPNRETTDLEEIWALKDVSFEIKQGERIGIIGRNGAGKSTLLKILSRITHPTTGRVHIKGRVASLLEVGTGFHPELTGRENVYLNGAVLGMTRTEIKAKFDEIVAFAEVEKFLDTPVKRYSSGMYVRLAFAVAAHLEPKILLVDEVLAVGDAAFQKKCLGKMKDVAKEGRTVLFVSHNMGAINRLCEQVIWLNSGCIRMIGDPEDIISAYLSEGSKERGECRWDDSDLAPGDEDVRLRAIRIRNSLGNINSALDIRFPFCIEIEYQVLQSLSDIRIGFRLITSDGIVVFTASDESKYDKIYSPGVYISRCDIPENLLNIGHYALFNVWADIPHVKVMFLIENPLSFHVEQTGGIGDQFGEDQKKWSGIIRPMLHWTTNLMKETEL